jgi:hypothetical protein
MKLLVPAIGTSFSIFSFVISLITVFVGEAKREREEKFLRVSLTSVTITEEESTGKSILVVVVWSQQSIITWKYLYNHTNNNFDNYQDEASEKARKAK